MKKKNHCKKGYALIKNKLMQNKSLLNLNNTNNALIQFFLMVPQIGKVGSFDLWSNVAQTCFHVVFR